jgi:hypothetical protein
MRAKIAEKKAAENTEQVACSKNSSSAQSKQKTSTQRRQQPLHFAAQHIIMPQETNLLVPHGIEYLDPLADLQKAHSMGVRSKLSSRLCFFFFGVGGF